MRISTFGSKAFQRLGVSKHSPLYRHATRTYWGMRSIRGRRFYSQFGEDAVLTTLMPDATGIYVDVGAGHPTQGSNTYAFYRRGWRGVLVEPISSNIVASRILRRGDTIIQALCGDEVGSLTFYEFDAWQLSTTSRAVVERLALEGHSPIAATEISTITLSQLEIEATPDSPSILSIDVEGAELAVLNGNDRASFVPAVICLEQWASPLKASSELDYRMESLGYRLYNYVGNSGIWLHTESAYWR